MKKYIYVYNYYKELIISGQLKLNDKVPSLRYASQLHGVSKTTIQNAYFDLQADGYIIPVARSGYIVSYSPKEIEKNSTPDNVEQKIIYNFTSGEADINSFDFRLWQRYIRSAFRQQERLLTYSIPQGEKDLREALSDYIREKRNVTASPDRIIIGAGVHSLMSILCSLVKDRNTISFPDSSFVQGMSLCNDYGFEVHTRDKDADIVYVSPSHMTAYGDVMPLKRRLELTEYSKKQHSLVIEDDYDSDFLYNKRPTPSLFALSGEDNVIYMGSFSNVLVPGIRLSFMVLTKELSDKYHQNIERYSQTASKTEQIALCNYIRDGHITSQTKKIRRLYTTKTKTMLNEINRIMPDAKAILSENALQVKLTSEFKKSTQVFKEHGVKVFIEKYENNKITLVLSPSSIKNEEISKAVEQLNKCFN